ncbi:MAG TPA: dehydrogenase [Methanosarcinales archaeon]|nr:dehydrogenase [Methanosarcinales archaeon]
MKKKLILLVLILILAIAFSGCVSNKRSVSIEEQSVSINSLIFTRTGAVIELNQELPINTVSISNKTSEDTFTYNANLSKVFLEFNWDASELYKIEINKYLNQTYSAPSKPSPYELKEIKLEDVQPANFIKTTSNPKEVIEISPNSQYAIIGTANGFIRLINLQTLGEEFRKKIPEATITAIAFSGDGKYVLVGEKSAETYLYLYDLTGKEVWKYSTAKDLGSASLYYKPKITHIAVFKDKAYVSATFLRKVNKVYYYNSRIYNIDIKSGEVVWKFPKNENIDSGVYYLDTNGKYVVFATGSWTSGKKYREGTVYCLNKFGELEWSYTIEPLKPYWDYVTIWYSTTISPDGKYIATFTSDGRAFLFNNSEILKSKIAKVRWQKNLSTPIEISGIPIYASANIAKLTEKYVIFSVGSTFNPPSAKGHGVPIEHPMGNTLFVFDIEGNLKWKWKVEGYAEDLKVSKDGKYIVAAIAQNLVTKDTGVHGIYVFNTERLGGASSKLEWVYHTQGISVASAISPDNKYIVAISAPIDVDITEKEDIIGEHKVIMLT